MKAKLASMPLGGGRPGGTSCSHTSAILGYKIERSRCTEGRRGMRCCSTSGLLRGRGYGFVQPDGGGPEYFTHIRQLTNASEATPTNGTRIQFLAEMDPNHGKLKTQQWAIIAGGAAAAVPAAQPQYAAAATQYVAAATYAPQPAAATFDGCGTLKKWYPEKGFGFILPDDGTDTFFAHVRQLTNGAEGSFTEGVRVSYKSEWDAKQNKMKASTWSLVHPPGVVGAGAHLVPPPGGMAGVMTADMQARMMAAGMQMVDPSYMHAVVQPPVPQVPQVPQVTQEVAIPRPLVDEVLGPGSA
eukprot:909919-Amphidinium_carterae.1